MMPACTIGGYWRCENEITRVVPQAYFTNRLIVEIISPAEADERPVSPAPVVTELFISFNRITTLVGVTP